MAKATIYTCDQADERLEAYLDGELGEFEAARLRRHLSSCAACAAELAWAERVQEGLRALPEHSCPPQVLEDVLRRTALAPRPQAPRPQGHSPQAHSPQAPGPRSLSDRPAPQDPTPTPNPEAISERIPTRSERRWSYALRAAVLAAGVALVVGALWQGPAPKPSAPPSASLATTLQESPALDSPSVAASSVVPPPATIYSSPTASPAELSQARAELQLALATLDQVNRRAARMVRDRALVPHVVEAPGAALGHMDRQL